MGVRERVYAGAEVLRVHNGRLAFLFVGLLALVFLESRGGGKITFDLVYLATISTWPSPRPGGCSWPSPSPSP